MEKNTQKDKENDKAPQPVNSSHPCYAQETKNLGTKPKAPKNENVPAKTKEKSTKK